jgi:hypothetical protein
VITPGAYSNQCGVGLVVEQVHAHLQQRAVRVRLRNDEIPALVLDLDRRTVGG